MTDINLKSSTIEKGLELAQGLLDKIAAPGAEELGLMISDNIKHRRFKNQIKNLTKVRKIVEENEMTLKQVNLKVLFPYLEGIAIEEDEALQDIWANLFINYIDSKKNLTITVYPNILKQLSSKEVRMILNMYNKKDEEFKFKGNCIIKTESDSPEINNLERIGLISDIVKAGFLANGPHNSVFELTDFGYDFVNACTLNENL